MTVCDTVLWNWGEEFENGNWEIGDNYFIMKVNGSSESFQLTKKNDGVFLKEVSQKIIKSHELIIQI